MSSYLTLLNLFSGPLWAIENKAVVATIMYLIGAGIIEPTADVKSITAAVLLILSTAVSALTRTQTAKIQDVNETENGVKVVPQGAPVQTVHSPMPTRGNGFDHDPDMR